MDSIFQSHTYKLNPLSFHLPTFRLLLSSILVAFSGVMRVYIASLLLQTHTSLFTCLAGGLIIYSVYTLDRALDSTEDKVNREDLNGSNKNFCLVIALITFLIGSFVFLKEGLLIFAFIPFVTGYLYSKGLKIGKHHLKLKGGLGVKNIVTGVTWGLCTAGVASNNADLLPFILVFTFFGIKLFVNSAIYDFKDVNGDMLAGIKTLPVSLGVQKTRNLLVGLHTVSHFILFAAVVNGVIGFEPLIIIYSFVCGIICLLAVKIEDSPSQKLKRVILIDGESFIIVGLRLIANAPVL